MNVIHLNLDNINLRKDGPKLIEPISEISYGLEYHIRTNRPIKESVFREGSENFNNLIKESAELLNRGVLILNDEDITFIKEMNNNE